MVNIKINVETQSMSILVVPNPTADALFVVLIKFFVPEELLGQQFLF